MAVPNDTRAPGKAWVGPLGLAAALLGLGCSADVVDTEDASAGGLAQGLVVVERGATLGLAAQQAPRTQVAARFLRPVGLEADAAERVMGLARALPAPGTCSRNGAPAPVPVQASASIELLDVGEVYVQAAGGSSVVLAARAFPDVGDLVSGVVYTSRDETADVAPGVSYLVETSGSSRVDAFSSRAEAPESPDGILLAGLPLDGDDLALPVGAPLALRWEPGTRADTIYVELRWDGGEPVVCTFDDVGRGEVPAVHARPEGARALELGVHRLRRTPLRFEGDGQPSDLGGAQVEFDFAVVADIALAEPAGG
ncbi:MAG: hypothetical protein IT373_09555 [Polyangiaceae bacterium]|nr:hypothetical protein [Polyangiaceae bacterium]